MVIAYIVITPDQQLEPQKLEVATYASHNNLTIDRWITDTAIDTAIDTIGRYKRNVGRIIKNLNYGDILIVTRTPRLSHSLHEYIRVINFCIDNKISIHCTDDGFINDQNINHKIRSFAMGLAFEIEKRTLFLTTLGFFSTQIR